MAAEPPRTIGQPTACAYVPSTRPNDADSGRSSAHHPVGGKSQEQGLRGIAAEAGARQPTGGSQRSRPEPGECE